MLESVPKSNFETAYENNQPPWDIDGPQPDLVRVADRITDRVLDCGCGTGENTLFFALRGCTVTGFDFLEAPIAIAKKKANERGISATLLVNDALKLKNWNEKFDNIIDSGLFHVFSDEDMKTYIEGLAHVIKPGGHLFLLCFSDAEPEGFGPRRIPRAMIYERFKDGWEVESIGPTRFGTRKEFWGSRFSQGGPHAWFAIIRKF